MSGGRGFVEDWKLPWEGGCRCGDVRVRVTQPPMLTSACHCTGCQRMTGGAFSLTLNLPTDGFEVTKGETVIGGTHGEQIHHHHCDHCKSWVFTRVDGLDFLVNLRATMLDDPSWFRPFAEFWTSEKLPGAETGAVHSHPTIPEMDGFQPLVAAFAEHPIRP
jgi:hypothetical protein